MYTYDKAYKKGKGHYYIISRQDDPEVVAKVREEHIAQKIVRCLNNES